MLGDTIAAVSTPRGKGGVALLRVSGSEAVKISGRVFKPHAGKDLSLVPARTAVYGAILAPDDKGDFLPVDDGIAVVFRAPSSFTGEDTVEITCHGGILLTEKILASLFAAGAKPAMAGEFTRRAFLNGKLGLSAAEALGLILDAKTDAQLTLAHTGLSGRVEKETSGIYDSLRSTLAAAYAKIDYPDEDLAGLTDDEMRVALSGAKGRVEALLATYRTGRPIAERIATVICGKPNVGKSSLYNRLVGRDAAIVTDVEGTTRDILSETVPLGKVTLRLYDTAGLRASDDRVEKIGIDRAKEALEQAELIFALFDGSRPVSEEDETLANSLASRQAAVVAIVTKSDLSSGNAVRDFCRAHFSTVISLSAETGEGMEELERAVEARFVNGDIDLRQDAVITNARQYASALSAKEALARAEEGLAAGLPAELVCTDVENAMAALSELDGREISEDIVSEIFSRFCVGK